MLIMGIMFSMPVAAVICVKDGPGAIDASDRGDRGWVCEKEAQGAGPVFPAACVRNCYTLGLAPDWIDQWCSHGDTDPDTGALRWLPNSSSSPTDDQSGPGFRTWSVTANFGAGVQTASGVAWCGTSANVPPTAHASAVNCWCRMTSPVTGPWVWGHTYPAYGGFTGVQRCVNLCARLCARCVQEGGHAFCRRSAVLNFLNFF